MSRNCLKPSISAASRLALVLPLALLLLTGVQQSVLAGITQSVPFTGQLNFGGTGTFTINGGLNQFDPSLGQLTGVELSLSDVVISGNVLFQDLATGPESNPQVDTLFSMRYFLSISDIPPGTTNSLTFTLDSSPGNTMPPNPLAQSQLQFGQTTSVVDNYSYTIPAGPSFFFDPLQTPLFEGNGTIPFTLDAVTNVTFEAGSPSNTVIESTDIAGLLNLTYITAPEINVAPIAGLALLAGTFWVLARRRAARA